MFVDFIYHFLCLKAKWPTSISRLETIKLYSTLTYNQDMNLQIRENYVVLKDTETEHAQLNKIQPLMRRNWVRKLR